LPVRVRVRFAKAGKLRFISAIDLGRVWERALRKAALPIAYSEGFSPHPKVGFGDALPLGYASAAEFAELTFTGPVDPADVAARLDAAFPPGLSILDAVESLDGDVRLGRLLQASLWALDYPDAFGVADAVAALPAEGPLEVRRDRKGELVTVDLRPALLGLVAEGAQVRAVVHHPGALDQGGRPSADGPTAAVRAEDLHAVLGLPRPPVLITRLAQGRATTTPPGVADALRDTTTPLAAAAVVGAREPARPAAEEPAR
jgi:radical SAM-linked protein